MVAGLVVIGVVIAICKDTKLKAIHNRKLLQVQPLRVVIAICKDTKLKAIHNSSYRKTIVESVVIAICKDTKLKAIHNVVRELRKMHLLLLLFAKILN